MEQQEKLKSLIKNGLWQNINLGENLLGEPIVDKGYLPVSFSYLVQFCTDNNITGDQLSKAICKYGSKELVAQALFATKDISSYAKAWLEHEKNLDVALNVLKNMGATEAEISELKMNAQITGKGGQPASMGINLFDREEDFVKFYLLGDKQRLWRFIKSKKVSAQKGESLIAKAFSQAGIDLTRYINVFKDIQNPKIYADVCWCVKSVKTYDFFGEIDVRKATNQANDNLFVALQLLANYYEKFDDYALMDDYLALVFGAVKEFNYSKRELKQYNGKSVNDVLGEHLYNLFKAVFASTKIPVLKKINFALYNGFRGVGNATSFDTKILSHLGDLEPYIGELAKQYMLYLGGTSGISSANQTNYRAIGYIDYDDVKRLYSGSLRDFAGNFKCGLINHCFELLKQGYLQEFVKFYYINGTSYLDEYKNKFVSRLLQDVNLSALKQKYWLTSSYQQLPVPFEYLWEKEIACRRAPKYPFFILARNAKKQPNFVPEILGEQMFYEEGFNGRLFAEKNREFKHNVNGSMYFTDVPAHPDLEDIYKASAMTPKEKQRREYYAKYFGELSEDYQDDYYDNSEQALAFERSVEMVDSDPLDEPQNAQAEEENYQINASLDVDDLEAPEPEIDDEGDEIDREWDIDDMSTDESWEEDFDNHNKEKSIEAEWQTFRSLLTGETQKDISSVDCNNDEADANAMAALNQYLEQKLREDGFSEDYITETLQGASLEELLDLAEPYLADDNDAYDDDAFTEQVEDRLQEDIEENGYQPSNLTDGGSVCEYLAKEDTCFNALQEEGADPFDSDDIEEYYMDIADQIEVLIEKGEYEKVDKYLQELMGEPKHCDDINNALGERISEDAFSGKVVSANGLYRNKVYKKFPELPTLKQLNKKGTLVGTYKYEDQDGVIRRDRYWIYKGIGVIVSLIGQSPASIKWDDRSEEDYHIWDYNFDLYNQVSNYNPNDRFPDFVHGLAFSSGGGDYVVPIAHNWSAEQVIEDYNEAYQIETEKEIEFNTDNRPSVLIVNGVYCYDLCNECWENINDKIYGLQEGEGQDLTGNKQQEYNKFIQILAGNIVNDVYLDEHELDSQVVSDGCQTEDRTELDEWLDDEYRLEQDSDILQQDEQNWNEPQDNVCFGQTKSPEEQDVQAELAGLNEQIMQDIQNGTYDGLDKYLQQLMGEPEKYRELMYTAQGSEFLRGQYEVNRLNWGLPVDRTHDEDSPDYIPF